MSLLRRDTGDEEIKYGCWLLAIGLLTALLKNALAFTDIINSSFRMQLFLYSLRLMSITI
jgi:hypothetical protein